MKRLAALLLFLSLAVPAFAGPSFEEAAALYDDKDYKSAMEIAGPLATAGDARAMAMMGAMYQKGEGVKTDLDKAIDWYTKAAEAGHTAAQFALGMIYLDGSLGS